MFLYYYIYVTPSQYLSIPYVVLKQVGSILASGPRQTLRLGVSSSKETIVPILM